VRAALDESLAKLGCGYIDLYLMHWPMAMREDGSALPPDESPTIADTWRDMVDLLNTGKVRSIGVSNYSMQTLENLLAHTTVVPAVNQVEMHPLLPQHALAAFCARAGIRMTAYTPLAKHKLDVMAHPLVCGIATARACTPAQVVLGWLRARGVAVIPKTKTRARMEENLIGVSLSDDEFRALDGLHAGPGMHRSACGFHSKGGMAFGWTYEQLGWPMKDGGVVW